MHPTALSNCQRFFDAYGTALQDTTQLHIVEVGSQDVNGSLRELAPSGARYTGLDFVAGKGVDVVMEDPYRFPLPDACADVVLASSCFEHAEMFWITYLEVLRVLKPHGLFYLNAPSNGVVHRYPVDCWRFYPDSGKALVSWARRNGMHAGLLESYTSAQSGGIWNDFVAVFVKDQEMASRYPKRILDELTDFSNAWRDDCNALLQPTEVTEDQKTIVLLAHLLKVESAKEAAGQAASPAPS